MTRKELYENKLQMDYFSDNYIRFEEDFQKYSAMNVPLTFLIDDILRTMAINQKDYFVLNKENAKDGREHRFYFRVEMEKDCERTRTYAYAGLKNSSQQTRYGRMKSDLGKVACEHQKISWYRNLKHHPTSAEGLPKLTMAFLKR